MTTEERDRRMAMLRAAQPYTSGRQRYALDLVLQANALLSTARGGMAGDLEACETTARPEEMLMHMQEFCTAGSRSRTDDPEFYQSRPSVPELPGFHGTTRSRWKSGSACCRIFLPICQSTPDAFAAPGRLWRYGKLQPSDGISDHTAFPGTTAAFRTAKELHPDIR